MKTILKNIFRPFCAGSSMEQDHAEFLSRLTGLQWKVSSDLTDPAGMYYAPNLDSITIMAHVKAANALLPEINLNGENGLRAYRERMKNLHLPDGFDLDTFKTKYQAQVNALTESMKKAENDASATEKKNGRTVSEYLSGYKPA